MEGQTKEVACISETGVAIDKLLMAFDRLFGCWHRNVSRPLTLSGWTYEVCLSCGKQFPYTRAEIGRGASQQKDLCSTLAFRHENHPSAPPQSS